MENLYAAISHLAEPVSPAIEDMRSYNMPLPEHELVTIVEHLTTIGLAVRSGEALGGQAVE